MGSFSLGHWVVVLLVIVLLFGAGRIPQLMGDMAKGIKAFRSGIKDENDQAQNQIEGPKETAPRG